MSKRQPKKKSQAPEPEIDSLFIGPPGGEINKEAALRRGPVVTSQNAQFTQGQNEAGEVTNSLQFELTLKDALLFTLSLWAMDKEKPERAREEANEAYSYLREYLLDLKLVNFSAKTVITGTAQTKFSTAGDEGEDEQNRVKQTERYLNRPVVIYALLHLYGQLEEFLRLQNEEYELSGQKAFNEEIYTPEEIEEINKSLSAWILPSYPPPTPVNGLPKNKGGRPQKEPPADTGSIRIGGHFIDGLLPKSQRKKKPGGRSKKEGAPTLFDELQKSTREKILNEKVDIEQINRKGEGITLTQSEWKLITVIWELVHLKSANTREPGKPDFYAGNGEREVISYGEVTIKAVRLSATLYEITERYAAGKRVGGKDIENVRRMLIELADNPEKRHLIRYTRFTKNDKGGKTKYEVERWSPLLTLDKIRRTEYDANDVETSKREETVIQLNPVLYDQIESKYIVRPVNLAARIEAAYGGGRMPEAVSLLVDYLSRFCSNRIYEPAVFLTNLYETIAPTYFKEGRRALIKKQLEEAVRVCQGIGLLIEYKTEGAGSREKAIFSLNKDWVKETKEG